LQLQRAHLEASDAYAYSKLLDAENTRLKEELTVLRDNPEPPHAPRELTELTLALRRVSDKLSHTESILLQRTTELAHAISEKMGMQLEVNASHAEADRIRQAEFECKSRERELKRKCKAAEEEARMADAVVMEYADLVRSMEGRMSKAQDISEGVDDGHSRVSVQVFQGWCMPYYHLTFLPQTEDPPPPLLHRHKAILSYDLSLRIGIPSSDFSMNSTRKPLVFKLRSRDFTLNFQPF
jgi:hypothetical protein